MLAAPSASRITCSALALLVSLWAAGRRLVHALGAAAPPRPRPRAERGQATTEYALVLLGAAAVALLLVAWATRTGAFGSLLDAVMDSIKKKV